MSERLLEKDDKISKLSNKCQSYKEKLCKEASAVRELKSENIELHKKVFHCFTISDQAAEY